MFIKNILAENLFAEQVLIVRDIFTDSQINNVDFEEIEKQIESLYLDNSEDIESFSDMLMLINNFLIKCIKDVNWNSSNILKLLSLRMRTKKLTKKKTKEGLMYLNPDKKYESGEHARNYFNVEECAYSYHECVEYVWKPSILKLEEANQYRCGCI